MSLCPWGCQWLPSRELCALKKKRDMCHCWGGWFSLAPFVQGSTDELTPCLGNAHKCKVGLKLLSWKKKKRGTGTTILYKNYKIALDSQCFVLKCFLLSLKNQSCLPRTAICPLGRRRALSRMGEKLQRQFSPQIKNFQKSLQQSSSSVPR